MKTGKYLLDLLMTMLCLLCLGYQLTDGAVHEWAGLVLLLLFFVHCILNRKWFGNLSKIWSAARKKKRLMVSLIINILLAVNMIILLITSILISREIFTFSEYAGCFAARLHGFSAYLSWLLITIHFGMHLESIVLHIQKQSGKTFDRESVTAFSRTILALFLVAGIAASVKNGYWKHFLLENHKNKYDVQYEQPTVTAENEGNSQSESTDKNTSEIKDETEIQNDTESQITTEQDDKPTLQEYLSKLVCTGCGKRCLLTNPRCMKGQRQAEQAKSQYEAEYGDAAD